METPQPTGGEGSAGGELPAEGQSPAGTQAAPMQVVRIIYFALIGGVLTFAVVAGVATGWGAAGVRDAGGGPAIMAYAWAALAIATFPAVLFFRARARKAAGLDQAGPDPGRPIDRVLIQTSLLISWALVEGPALFGIVIFFLFGRVDILAYALAVAAVGWAVTFPSREYFQEGRGRGLG